MILYRGRFDIKFFVLNIWYLIYLIYFLIIVLKIIEIFRMIKWSGSIVLYIYISKTIFHDAQLNTIFV